MTNQELLSLSQSTPTWRLGNLPSADCVTPWNGFWKRSVGNDQRRNPCRLRRLGNRDIQAVLFYAARLSQVKRMSLVNA